MRRALPYVAGALIVVLVAFTVTAKLKEHSDQVKSDAASAAQLEQDQAVYSAQVKACRRGNKVRRELNKRGHVLKTFLVTAASARFDAARLQVQAGQRGEARVNRKAARLWRDTLAPSVQDIHVPYCPAKFPDPGT